MIPKFARYKYCISKSIEFLLNENINNFPYDSDTVIKKHKWARQKYSELAESHDITMQDIVEAYGSKDGYSIYSGRNYTIAYNDYQIPKRIYFTKLHEIGHIYLNHFIDFNETIIKRSNLSKAEYKVLENEANCFARNIIAPAVLVKHLNLNNPYKIEEYFGITSSAAKTRLDLINLDYKYITKDDENSLLLFFQKTIYRILCLNCNHGFVYKDANYCPICGQKTLKWGNGSMLYDVIDLNERGKAKTCPICENENTDIEGGFCQICGTHILNECTYCDAELTGEYRYCPVCGSPSTFYRDNLLKDWKVIKKEQEDLNSFLGLNTPETTNNFYSSTPEEDFDIAPVDDGIPF